MTFKQFLSEGMNSYSDEDFKFIVTTLEKAMDDAAEKVGSDQFSARYSAMQGNKVGFTMRGMNLLDVATELNKEYKFTELVDMQNRTADIGNLFAGHTDDPQIKALRDKLAKRKGAAKPDVWSVWYTFRKGSKLAQKILAKRT